MFSKKRTNESTDSYLTKLTAIKEKIGQADAVVIGAGAGLSTAAGFTYSGERFDRFFLILPQTIIFPTCIPEAFIIMIRWKNIGPTGAGTST